MSDLWCERALDWWMDYVVFLPMTVTYDSKRRIVRIIGFFSYFLWLPTWGVSIWPAFALMLSLAFQETWRGEL